MKAALLLLTLLPVFALAQTSEVETLKAELAQTKLRLEVAQEASAKWKAIALDAVAKAQELNALVETLDSASQKNYKAAEEWKQEANRLAKALNQKNAAAYYAAEDARRERMLAPTPRAGASTITIIQTADGHWQTSDGTQVIRMADGQFQLVPGK